MLAREADDGRIENVYMLQIMNTEEIPHRYRVSVDGNLLAPKSPARPKSMPQPPG